MRHGVSNDGTGRRRFGGMVAGVAILHGLGLALLAAAAIDGYMMFGLGLLAYLFGLRHAFDVDHIAAIDNVTRKLTRGGRSAHAAGFAFSLGHSTVVFALCALVVVFARQIQAHLASAAGIGGLIGTLASASFLTLIGLLNLQLLRQLWRHRRAADSGSPGDNTVEMERLLAQRGLFARVLGRGYRWIDSGWKMYPVGLVFGLGFDTATEVALLGLSASAAQKTAWAPWMIMALPLLFAAGMTLMDSSNGLFMQRAYRWSEARPGQRFGFNIAVTTLSVALALMIAGVEWLGLAAGQWAPEGVAARTIAALPSGMIGGCAVILFIAIWLGAYGWQQRRRAVVERS